MKIKILTAYPKGVKAYQNGDDSEIISKFKKEGNDVEILYFPTLSLEEQQKILNDFEKIVCGKGSGHGMDWLNNCLYFTREMYGDHIDEVILSENTHGFEGAPTNGQYDVYIPKEQDHSKKPMSRIRFYDLLWG